MGTKNISSATQHRSDTFQATWHVESGLGAAQVNELQGQYGKNTLASEGGVRWYAVLLKKIPSAEVVPGDIVIIKTGDTIPANLGIFESMNLEYDEKIVKGEDKDTEFDFSSCNPLECGEGGRFNMAYSPSTVTKGRARGIVVFTGINTEIGNIAESMRGTQRKPNRPLSRKSHGNLQFAKGLVLRIWDSVGKFLGFTVVPYSDSCNLRNFPGIAVIPESLVAVLTITFVTDMTQMRKHRVLMRKLSALEALGRITNICSDKQTTVTAISKVGITSRDFSVLSSVVANSLVEKAAESNSMTDKEIHAMPELPFVTARCAPNTKSRMIATLHRRKGCAPIIGDGVNDSPSLQAADKFDLPPITTQLLASNIAEAVLLVLGLCFQDNDGFPVFPLLPLRIVWINMVTSGFPTFSLDREKVAYDVMNQPPRFISTGVFSKQIIADTYCTA
ncbi:calcium ATPase [Lepidopterella palustris CBS 459.81]|uniref:Calcium ATPase n=1 Tax=Lepidopterella palustris CBS 459.81 TaxID=1314670 RepID=A0A8E2EAL6_9PEZI|nr:calcium ATPase [Lepidopterella palustris CBS 459.81]